MKQRPVEIAAHCRHRAIKYQNMKEPQHIPWKRISVEAAAIVASILLAFAIDAWWQRRAELEQANALVVSLYADFQSSQAHLE